MGFAEVFCVVRIRRGEISPQSAQRGTEAKGWLRDRVVARRNGRAGPFEAQDKQTRPYNYIELGAAIGEKWGVAT